MHEVFKVNYWRINAYCAYHNLKIKALFTDDGELLVEDFVKEGDEGTFINKKICLFAFIGEELPQRFEIMDFLSFVELIKSKGYEHICHIGINMEHQWHTDAVDSFTKDCLDGTISAHPELSEKYEFLKEKVYRISEEEITDYVIDYLVNKSKQKWTFKKLKRHIKRKHGADIDIRGNEQGTRRFIIECKGKSTAKTYKARNSIDKEGWLVALGQVITRMTSKRIVESGKTKSRAAKGTCYGLALYWKGAQSALNRIGRNVSEVLNLYVFSVDDNGFVKMFTPSKFENEYSEEDFHKPLS